MSLTTHTLPSGTVAQVKDPQPKDLSAMPKGNQFELIDHCIPAFVIINGQPVTAAQLEDMPTNDVVFLMGVIADKCTDLALKIAPKTVVFPH